MPQRQIYDNEVYLEITQVSLGYLDTSRQARLENYWLAHLLPNGDVNMVLLDINNEPSGLSEVIEAEVFHSRFVHQPGYYDSIKNPRQRLIDVIVEQADQHRESKEYLSAEYEYKKALRLDEESVRANFGLGLNYMAQGEVEQAREVFFRLANINAVYQPQHKHLFNEFGIQLRTTGLYQEALEHYHRALSISKTDENLWFNLGRALYEHGHRVDLARRALERALKLNPKFLEAKAYLMLIETSGEPAASKPAAAAMGQPKP